MEQSPNRDTKGKKTKKGRKEGSGQIENGHTRRGKKKKSILLCLSCFYFYGERRLPSHAVGKKIIRSIPYMLLFCFLNGYRGLRSGSRRTRKRREIRKGVGEIEGKKERGEREQHKRTLRTTFNCRIRSMTPKGTRSNGLYAW